MRAISLALVFALGPTAALADCAGGTEILSCQIGKKVLEVCHTDTSLTYSFGPKAKPDLFLTVPVAKAAYTPWSGVGRAMWDSLAFGNAGVTYEVWSSIDRMDEAAVWEGGVNVLQGEAILAELTCAKGTLHGELSVIYDLKEKAGQCWNYQSFSWQPAPCP